MPGRFAFLPHARNAVSTAASRSGIRLSSSFSVQITGDGSNQGNALPMDATLRGPGDVIGITPDQIARFEPEGGQRGFEPQYFPFVEFVDVDLPWRYSLETGNPAQLHPWIALIALRDDEFDLADQGRRPLPRLIVRAGNDSLPNLSQAWAWAHVQVNLDDAGGRTAEEMLADDPANGFARVFCCRQLDPRTRYHLFVVPIYEAGRVAGLGQRPEATLGQSFAWSHTAPGQVELPYYAKSMFTTDAGADIEALLRKLRAFKADDGDEPGAPQHARADRPGYYPNYKPGKKHTFEIQTALTQADLKAERYNTDPPLANAMAKTLTEVIAGEGDDPDEDPLVAFPPYGFRFQQEEDVSAADANKNKWFDRLNLDLKFRHAAARGATVVAENQDEFAQLAWDQYDEIMEANQQLRQLRVAEQLANRFATKHLSKLSHEVVTVLAEPMQPYVEVPKAGGAISDVLINAGSPGVFASRGMRRQSAKRPVKAQGQTGTKIPAPAIKGDTSSNGQRPAPAPGGSVLLNGNILGGAALAHYTSIFGTVKNTAKPQKSAFQVKPLRTQTFSQALRGTMTALPQLKADFVVKGRTAEEEKELDPLWRAPHMPVPLAPKLTAVARDAILSGIGDLPDNTVSLYTENRAFIEAFMVGANHAMNDELRWREFPTDMRGTVLDRFWDRAASATGTDGAEIGGIDKWKSRLGRNPNPSNPDGNAAMVLVIKGDVVRKLDEPIVVVNEGAGTNWAPGKGKDFEPVFSGKLGRETVYFGFDLPNASVLANPENFRLVIYEPMGRLRFGLDVATAKIRRDRTPITMKAQPFPMAHRQAALRVSPPQTALVAAPPQNNIGSWDDLSWSHMRFQNGYINFGRNISVKNGDDLWGRNKTSASLARSFWQKPVAAVMPFSRVVP